jgi:hypothetical protein
VQSPKWALGYLRGRIKGYRKGNVPRASVLTAIEMAQDYKVPTADIIALLQAAGLAYDFKTRKLLEGLRRWPSCASDSNARNVTIVTYVASALYSGLLNRYVHPE